MIWELPTQVEVAGTMRDVRTDYRDILKILIAFEDPELELQEKAYVCLEIFYKDFDNISPDDYEAAYTAAIHFIDNGAESDKPGPRTIDWEQDAGLMIPAVNRVAGCEIRALEYMHWWTFLAYFMEINECVYSTILRLRAKKAKGKKLEKYEREFWNANKKACVIQPKLTDEEKAERDRLKAMIG